MAVADDSLFLIDVLVLFSCNVLIRWSGPSRTRATNEKITRGRIRVRTTLRRALTALPWHPPRRPPRAPRAAARGASRRTTNRGVPRAAAGPEPPREEATGPARRAHSGPDVASPPLSLSFADFCPLVIIEQSWDRVRVRD